MFDCLIAIPLLSLRSRNRRGGASRLRSFWHPLENGIAT